MTAQDCPNPAVLAVHYALRGFPEVRLDVNDAHLLLSMGTGVESITAQSSLGLAARLYQMASNVASPLMVERRLNTLSRGVLCGAYKRYVFVPDVLTDRRLNATGLGHVWFADSDADTVHDLLGTWEGHENSDVLNGVKDFVTAVLQRNQRVDVRCVSDSTVTVKCLRAAPVGRASLFVVLTAALFASSAAKALVMVSSTRQKG